MDKTPKKPKTQVIQAVVTNIGNEKKNKGGRPRKDGNTGDYCPPSVIYESHASTISPTSTSHRRNGITTNTTQQRYKNVWEGYTPFNESAGYVDISDVLTLVQRAYYNVPLLRNTIDVMTELTNSNIFLKGSNRKAKEIIQAWLNKINIWSLKEKFFREFFRSGNVFLYRFDAKVDISEINSLTRIYAEELKTRKVTIPIKYVILNPTDIRLRTDINFQTPQFFKMFNGVELQRLKNPKTEQDKLVFESLSPEEKDAIRKGVINYSPLDPDRLYAIFYKKQDYEPFAVPMAFPVLDDINWKLELKKIDRAIARTTDWAILLLTTGNEPSKGGINFNSITALQQLMQNDSVKRTLIADYTTKGEWLIPDISKILSPEKYKQVNEDILMGLNAILFNTDEKFANTTIKVQVFLERLKEARNAFLNDFLKPEIKKFAKSMGLKSYPEPCFEEVSLKDELQFARVYTRLAELGILTPDETIEAIESGKLPDKTESLLNQAEYKKFKEDGLYQPVIGGAKGESGRPSGTGGNPQSVDKKITPIGQASEQYSLLKVKDSIVAVAELEEKMLKHLKSKYKVKDLTDEQKSVVKLMTSSIVLNEKPENWVKSIKSYCDKPKEIPQEINLEIEKIMDKHDLDFMSAMFLYLGK